MVRLAPTRAALLTSQRLVFVLASLSLSQIACIAPSCHLSFLSRVGTADGAGVRRHKMADIMQTSFDCLTFKPVAEA
jgi:hypothetical protein